MLNTYIFSKKAPRNSPRTPRSGFSLLQSSKNVRLPFLDSSIPQAMKIFEELPFLVSMVS